MFGGGRACDSPGFGAEEMVDEGGETSAAGRALSGRILWWLEARGCPAQDASNFRPKYSE